MKNAGVGVGLPDKGRAKLAVRDGKIELYSAASDIGQGCATVFVQMVSRDNRAWKGNGQEYGGPIPRWRLIQEPHPVPVRL